MTRKEAARYFKRHIDLYCVTGICREAEEMAIKALEQEPKTGHWIKVHPLQADDEGAYMCSCCEVGDWNLKGTENFCPNCGAKMESEAQS